MLATLATAWSWNLLSFALFRFLTGAGIGGEYTAVNSTIQELVPARFRGWTDLTINGSFWLGAAIGAAGSVVLLDGSLLSPEMGWRLAFAIGGGMSVIIFVMRLWIRSSSLADHPRPPERSECDCRGNRDPARKRGPCLGDSARADQTQNAHAHAAGRSRNVYFQ